MDMKEYLQQSARTAPHFNEGKELSGELLVLLQRELGKNKDTGDTLDQFKRHLYYGKDLANWVPRLPNTEESPAHLNASAVDLVHGMIGIITEASEVGEVLSDLLNGENIDEVNLVEELGDIMWYMALILRTLGYTFEDAGDSNINKLLKRFPNKFDPNMAITRDLRAEREQLEKDIAS